MHLNFLHFLIFSVSIGWKCIKVSMLMQGAFILTNAFLSFLFLHSDCSSSSAVDIRSFKPSDKTLNFTRIKRNCWLVAASNRWFLRPEDFSQGCARIKRFSAPSSWLYLCLCGCTKSTCKSKWRGLISAAASSPSRGVKPSRADSHRQINSCQHHVPSHRILPRLSERVTSTLRLAQLSPSTSLPSRPLPTLLRSAPCRWCTARTSTAAPAWWRPTPPPWSCRCQSTRTTSSRLNPSAREGKAAAAARLRSPR